MKELTQEQLVAGKDYLTALTDLGFVPDCLMWAYESREDRWVLLMATRYFDAVGPLGIAETLFKAYNAAVTPTQIDPFIVRLHSPQQLLLRELIKALRNVEKEPPKPGGDVLVGFGDLVVKYSAVYRFTEPRPLNDNLGREWSAIANKVNALAA